MANMGVLYHGLELMGGGAILSGLVLGAIAVFVIEKQFLHAAAFAAAGAVLTYFGLMHGEAIGIGKGLGVTPSISLAYAMVAGFLYLCSRSLVGARRAQAMISEPHGVAGAGRMSETKPAFDAARHLDAMAPGAGPDDHAEQRPGVLQFLGVAHLMSEIVRAAPLDDASFELAPVFRPGRTSDGEPA
jgi:hypothetical protein